MSDEAAALDRINQYRAQVGVPPATMHPALKASAAAHAAYYVQNAPVSGSIHDEIEGKPGFSGKDFFARAARFGYSNSQSTNENIDTIADPVAAVDRLMATLNHRIPMLDPAYPDMGIASSEAGGRNPITVLDFGMPAWKDSFQPQFISWPPDNGTNFFRSYRGEGPDLFRKAGLSPIYPIGCPITLTYRGSGKINFDTNAMSLTDAAGRAVDCLKLAVDEKLFWTARNTGVLAAVQPLAPGSTYTVSFSYSLNGGPPQLRSWKFSTGSGIAAGDSVMAAKAKVALAKPGPNLAKADPAVITRWQESDGPVAAGAIRRSWLYGADVFDSRAEAYIEGAGGNRTVYYFDKGRLEINNPAADRKSQWFVSSGLLVRELVSGNLQLGDGKFEGRGPAQVPVAGDPGPINLTAPTYASFSGLASLNNDHRAPDRTGQAVSESLSKEGAVINLPTPPTSVTFAYYDKTLGHNVPDVLLNWMKALPGDWVATFGLPLSEAYWMQVKLGGNDKMLLCQIFERRSLTFTPGNAPEWQVEAGNTGRHYFTWRYGG